MKNFASVLVLVVAGIFLFYLTSQSKSSRNNRFERKPRSPWQLLSENHDPTTGELSENDAEMKKDQ